MLPIIAVSAVVPSLLLIAYFRSRDLNPEPGRVIWTTFFFGVLTVVPVLLVDAPIVRMLGEQANPYAQGFGEAFFVAGFPEEFFKFLVVVAYASRLAEFDEPMDGIVYGAIASLGFATLENVLYVTEGGVSSAILRALTAVPGHAFMGAIMGYHVGRARFDPQRRTAWLIRGYLSAVLLHGLYDAGLLTVKAMSRHAPGAAPVDYGSQPAALLLLTTGVLVFEWIWAVRLVRRLHADQVAAGRTAWPQQVPPVGYGSNDVIPGQAPFIPPGRMPPAYDPRMGAYPPPGAVPMMNPPPAPMPGWGAAPPAMYAPPHMMPPVMGSGWHPGWRPPGAPGSTVGGWIRAIVGGTLGSIGGLFTLGMALAVCIDHPVSRSQSSEWLIAEIVVGVIPLAAGIALFRAGMKTLHPPLPAAMMAVARS